MPVMRRGAPARGALPAMWRLARRTRSAPPVRWTHRRASPAALGLVAAALVGGVTLSAPTPAQSSPSNGTLKGTVIDGARGTPRPGVRVTLVGAQRDGSDRTTQEVVTDRLGRYRFEGLPPGRSRVYAVQAAFDGGLFAGSPIQIPAGTAAPPVIDSKLRVWATTSDPAALLVKRDAIFLAPSGGDLGVIESVVVENTSRRAYVGCAGSITAGRRPTPGATPTLGFNLPSSADRASVVLVDSSWDGPPPVATDFGFGATVAIPPGETSTTFSYRATGSGGVFDASRTALYPTAELVVHAVRPLEVEGNRLTADGSVRVAGRTYTRWTAAGGIEAGDVVQVTATAQAGIELPLFAGIAAGLAALVAATALVTTRRRRSRHASPASSVPASPPAPAASPASSPPAPAARSPAVPAGSSRPSREEVVATIAALDLDHGSGRLGDEEWRQKRRALKGLLGESSSERTP
ncbi:hypothetical protein BH20ACT22_BH20ACT22_14190 [soil metagenome]